MSNILKIAGAGVSAAAEETDENFNQTVLLLHGDGTNGAQNNTFVDSSTNNFTITRNGNTTQGTFSPFSLPDGRWSNYFDGTGDYFSLTNSSDFDFGSGDFTIECFFYLTADASANPDGDKFATLFAAIPNSGSLSTDYSFSVVGNASSTGTGIVFGTRNSGTQQSTTYSATITKNAWHHVAVTKTSNTVSIFYDGVRVTQNAAVTNTVDTGGAPIKVGAFRYEGAGASLYNHDFPGYISNVRVIKGGLQYSGATYTVPTAPLTAVSGTELLTCQSNRFVDNSSNAFAITRNGDVKVTPFSPFAPTAAYSASVNGGSGYFDGTGDYLSVADNAALEIGASSFCIEGWIYLNALPASGARSTIVGKWGSSISYIFQVLNDSGTIKLALTYSTNGTGVAADITQTAAITTGAWHHVAVTRDSTTLRFFLNGVQQGSNQTVSATFHDNTSPINIGRNENSNSNFPNGYYSNIRLVVGSAVYTSGFTPSGPLTNITNTSLLLNFTNAGIFDQTGKNNLETVGNAQVDTSTVKFGTGSMKFDGTGDYLLVPDKSDLQLGTGPFTIEAWIYPNSTTSKGIVAKGTGGAGGSGWLLWINASDQLAVVYDATSTFSSSGTISTGVWTHVALVREGTGTNETKLYINGVNDGTGTISSDFNQTVVLQIGTDRNNNASAQWNGFIDDLRITKGVARYTTAFTPPTKEFPNL